MSDSVSLTANFQFSAGSTGLPSDVDSKSGRGAVGRNDVSLARSVTLDDVRALPKIWFADVYGWVATDWTERDWQLG